MSLYGVQVLVSLSSYENRFICCQVQSLTILRLGSTGGKKCIYTKIFSSRDSMAMMKKERYLPVRFWKHAKIMFLQIILKNDQLTKNK